MMSNDSKQRITQQRPSDHPNWDNTLMGSGKNDCLDQVCLCIEAWKSNLLQPNPKKKMKYITEKQESTNRRA